METELCSAGHVKAYCCDTSAIDNMKRDLGWAWMYSHHDACPGENVAMVAEAFDLDPHVLLDAVEARGWETHDTGFMRQIIEEAQRMWAPDNGPHEETVA